jgi:hypothetical protein
VTLLSQRGRISALNRLQRRHRELLLGVFLSDNEPPGEGRALGQGAMVPDAVMPGAWNSYA